jgi:uncharacterized protein
MRFRPLAVLILIVAPALAQQPKPEQLYQRALNALTGTGPSRNDVNAIDDMRRAAEAGYLPAQVTLGVMLDTGTATTANPSEALAWYKKAADQGDPLAAWLAGREYLAGIGVSRDFKEAEKWLSRGADAGDPFAAYLLATVKDDRDYPAAAPLYKSAAEQGLPQAQARYGQILHQGRGTSREPFEAYQWLLLAQRQGVSTVAEDLRTLEAELGSTRTEEAKTRALELEVTVARSVNAHGCTGWEGEFNQLPTPPPIELLKFCR